MSPATISSHEVFKQRTVLQAARLRQYSTDTVFAAYCAGRLDDASDRFDTLPAIVARAHIIKD